MKFKKYKQSSQLEKLVSRVGLEPVSKIFHFYFNRLLAFSFFEFLFLYYDFVFLLQQSIVLF